LLKSGKDPFMRNAFELLVPLAVIVAVSSGPGCSSSSGSGGGGGGNDASADTSVEDSPSGMDSAPEDSGMPQDTGTVDTSVIDANWKDTGGDDGGISDAATDAAPQCPPITTLHPPAIDGGNTTLYCPFSGADGGANTYCSAGSEHCCESTSSSTSSCDPIGTACASGDDDWQCADPNADCSGGTPVCCAPNATLVLGAAGCGNYATSMKSTTCVASTAACTGIIMCTSTSECPNGMTCTPFDHAANAVGGCK